MHAQHWDFGWKKLGGQKIFDFNTLLVHSDIKIEDPSNCVPPGDRQPEWQGRGGGPGHQWSRRRQRGAGAEPEDIPLRHQVSSQSFLHQSNAQVDKTLSQ